jgi:hypothetical protein
LNWVGVSQETSNTFVVKHYLEIFLTLSLFSLSGA